MAQIINHDVLKQTIAKVVEKDMNDALEAATKEVVVKLEEKIKRAVAARMIAMAGSHYNLEYMRNELHIRVKIGGNDVTI